MNMRIGSMVEVAMSSLVFGCVQPLVFATSGGCPTLLRVPQDVASIDAAVAQACAGVPLEVVVAPGTWTMAIDTDDPAISVTIRGVDKKNTFVTSGKPGSLLNARYGATVLLKHLTVTEAVESGATVEDIAWDLYFEDCIVRGCSGAFLYERPSMRPAATQSRFESCVGSSYAVLYLDAQDVTECEFIDCVRPVISWGGSTIADSSFVRSTGHAVQYRSTIEMQRCQFSDTNGNAVLGIGIEPLSATMLDCQFIGGAQSAVVDTHFVPVDTEFGGSLTLTNCTFIDNASLGVGGAMHVGINRLLSLVNCQFTGNSASGRGGAIAQEFGGYEQRFEAVGCTFMTNASTGSSGGAISVNGWDGFMRLHGCTFRENSARVGGALHADRNTYIVEDCTFEDNVATHDYAGAVFMQLPRKGSAIRRTNFVGNTSATFAGAVYLYYGFVTMPIEDCAFIGNATAGNGGAFATNLFTDIDMLRCRFEQNTAFNGSAIYAFGSGIALTIADCAFAGGTTSSPAGSAVLAGDPGVSVAMSMFCATGAEPLGALVVDAGGNCIAEYCTDFDANGTPDACECATNPALPSCCLGDLFNDGAVNAADLAVVLTQWGEKGLGLEADLDGNGVVNGVDLAIVLSQWGSCD
jgi:predicted outer membrane repeat protein